MESAIRISENPEDTGKALALRQASLFDVTSDMLLPARLEVRGTIHGNPVRGYAFLEHKRSVRVSAYQKKGVTGHLAERTNGEAFFIGSKPTNAALPGDTVLVIPDAASAPEIFKAAEDGKAHWYRPKARLPGNEDIAESEARCRLINESWTGQFVFRQEDRESKPPVKGLRRPQIGALYAALAHWSVTDDPATIVMPTGTGKTETMLALLVCARLQRLMVVVPNAALREQIADKFLTLGKLMECGCMPADARPPVVVTLEHRPTSAQEVDDIFRRGNVIVTTMNVAGQCSPEVQERMVELCSHLFIDEAHHIAARTWAEFRQRFRKKPILQFTATPFRMDGKRIDGRYIYTYPLTRAQKEGYFRRVNFVPILAYDQDDADSSIAARAERATFEVVLSDERAEFRQNKGSTAFASIRGNRKPLSEWFNEDPPIIHFANGDFLVFNELFELPRGAERQAFDPAKIAAWPWKGVNLRKESQGPEKAADSIQRHVIERTLQNSFGDYDVVFDGDGTGEVADIVALKRSGQELQVLLVHCKHSSADTPGARIDELYAVCGQAQKSVHWRESPRRLLKHLLHQEDLRLKAGKASRFEKGTRQVVQQLANASRELTFAYKVAIVQPGLSKAKITPAFLDVLGATESFLQETFSMPLVVVASA